LLEPSRRKARQRITAGSETSQHLQILRRVMDDSSDERGLSEQLVTLSFRS